MAEFTSRVVQEDTPTYIIYNKILKPKYKSPSTHRSSVYLRGKKSESQKIIAREF